MHILDLTRELYNAALQERRDAWHKARKSVTLNEQMRRLGEVKAARPEYQGVYAQVLQETLKRLDRAFQGFFARVKRGRRPDTRASGGGAGGTPLPSPRLAARVAG